ncbi:MAG: epoxyqueuosine reductase [bacterium]
MHSSEEIKSLALHLGADKCGIASADRFSFAPIGFRPTDVYSKCKSVAVFLKRMPSEVILAENPLPYSHTADLLYSALDQIGLNLCSELEKRNIYGIPVVTDVPYLHWDAENKHGMGIISLRHAAFNAGLGILGRNTLLINRECGNMVYIGAVLIDAEVGPDPVVNDFSCPPNCSLCLDACPVQALDGFTVIQKLCREISFFQHARGWDIYTCKECRKVCPLSKGVKS